MNNDIFTEYKMPVWFRKRGYLGNFRIILLEDGWEIYNGIVGGVCNKYGEYLEEEQEKFNPEGLIECLDQDDIIYPDNIGFYFYGLHYRIMDNEFKTKEEIQDKLNEIGKWIVDINKNAPADIEV